MLFVAGGVVPVAFAMPSLASSTTPTTQATTPSSPSAPSEPRVGTPAGRSGLPSPPPSVSSSAWDAYLTRLVGEDHACISTLTASARQLLRWRIGTSTTAAATQTQVAQRLGISLAQERQREQTAATALRKAAAKRTCAGAQSGASHPAVATPQSPARTTPAPAASTTPSASSSPTPQPTSTTPVAAHTTPAKPTSHPSAPSTTSTPAATPPSSGAAAAPSTAPAAPAAPATAPAASATRAQAAQHPGSNMTALASAARASHPRAQQAGSLLLPLALAALVLLMIGLLLVAPFACTRLLAPSIQRLRARLPWLDRALLTPIQRLGARLPWLDRLARTCIGPLRPGLAKWERLPVSCLEALRQLRAQVDFLALVRFNWLGRRSMSRRGWIRRLPLPGIRTVAGAEAPAETDLGAAAVAGTPAAEVPESPGSSGVPSVAEDPVRARAEEVAEAFNLGAALLERGDVAGAIEAFRRGDELGDAGSASNLGVLLEETGDISGALAAYGRAADRGEANGAFNLGGALSQQGDLDGALAAYRRADECGDLAAAARVGAILEHMGDIEGAIAAYRRAEEHGTADAAETGRDALQRLSAFAQA
jgi:tetratricopeptide (TPR) repeat protein